MVKISKEKKEALLKERRGIELRDMLLGQNQGKNAEENEFYPYRYFASEGFLPGYNLQNYLRELYCNIKIAIR